MKLFDDADRLEFKRFMLDRKQIVEAEYAGEIDELAGALETRFDGVIARNAKKIARFVIVWQIEPNAASLPEVGQNPPESNDEK